MQRQADVARRHFYGICAVAFGVWEAAAWSGVAPTITDTVRSNPWLKPVAVVWTAGLVLHLCRRPA